MLQRRRFASFASFASFALSTALLIGTIHASSAWAIDQDFDVPHSDLDTTSLDLNSASSSKGVSSLEIGISSYAPKNFSPTSSGANATSGFSTLSAPAISGTYVRRISPRFMGGQISLLAGIGLAALSRNEMLVNDAGTISASQEAYLLPVQIGVEYSVPTRYVTPRLSASALPTLALIPRSSVDDGTQDIGLGYELSAGASTPLRILSPNASLGVDVIYVGGTVDSGSLNGLGVQASVRLAM